MLIPDNNRKDTSMTTLAIAETGELHLILRGAEENRILATVRRWPYWQRVDIERDPANAERCLAVTLIADRVYESTVREILRRSFGMTFPEEGGSCDIGPEPAPSPRWRGRSSAPR
jgi:hypothetical protein